MLTPPDKKWYGLKDKESGYVLMILKNEEPLTVEDFAHHDVPLPKDDDKYEVIEIGIYKK